MPDVLTKHADAHSVNTSPEKVVILGPVCLFDLFIYVPVNSFQVCQDGSSWVEPLITERSINIFDHIV